MILSPAMNGLFSSAALAAFAESLVEGRRVLVFGSALSPTPRLLLERGARLVHVCDPAPLRVAEALRRPSVPGLTLSSLSDEEVAAREGTVDCLLVEHLGAFDARSIVEKARALLAVRGVALFVTPNRDANELRNRLLLWHWETGSLIGEWPDPLQLAYPGQQDHHVVAAGDHTALTVLVDGGIAAWRVSPEAWADSLCDTFGDLDQAQQATYQPQGSRGNVCR